MAESASMKGGLTAPRNYKTRLLAGNTTRFNEGGADRPPKRLRMGAERHLEFRFNEGGADRPPKHVVCQCPQ